MAKRSKTYLVFNSEGSCIGFRITETEARKICPRGGSVKFGYKNDKLRAEVSEAQSYKENCTR